MRKRPLHGAHRREGSSRALTIGAAAAVLLLSLVPVALVDSTAGAAPTLTLSENASPTVAFGDPSSVTLTASNNSTTPIYNVTYRDVLPPGVSYVSGSTTPTTAGEPTVLQNAPSTGSTTLIWQNVGDLEPDSTLAIGFQLQADTSGVNAFYPGSTYHDESSTYASTDPRSEPAFNADGTPVANPVIISAGASSATLVSALKITKSVPAPDGELPRGVHDHQVPYTITVTNNMVDATNSVVVDDWVPAGLEFLGCGGIDNTTNASGTNPGSSAEYPSAPALSAGPTLSSSVCPTPNLVETVSTTPPGQPAGVYTHVQWTLGNLAPGQVVNIEYLAAIPLRANTLSWSGATPSTTTGAQAANLDNNNGPETYHGEALTNDTQAQGDFQGTLAPGTSNPVSALTSSTVKAVDLATQKTVSDPNFTVGGTTTYTIDYQTSEYRFSTGVVITDTLPSGLCPLGPSNYATDASASECAPTGAAPTTPYTSVTENADRTFTITWNLGTLPPNTDASISFPVAERSEQVIGGNVVPVVAGDSLVNKNTISGTTQTTCFSSTTSPPTSPVADPLCTAPGATPIYGGEPGPTQITDDAKAPPLITPEPILTKAVGAVTPSPVNCATVPYLTQGDPGYPPVFGKGHVICFELTFTAPAGVSVRNATVTDFLPPNSTYVAGSATATAANTATSTLNDSEASSRVLTWTLGDPGPSGNTYLQPGQVFQTTIEITATADPSSGNSFDLVGNLAKATATNSAGKGISLRDQATYKISRPYLGLKKSVTSIANPGGTVIPGNTTTVTANDRVTYAVVVSNTGLLPAESPVVKDVLPSDAGPCTTDVSAISNGGTCISATTIQWSSLPTIAPQGSSGSTLTLTYTMKIPATAAPGDVYLNHAGVVSYQSTDNTGGVHDFYPCNNIDPTTPACNSPAADATAQVSVPGALLTKAVTPSSATIGQQVFYTVVATDPNSTTVYNGSLADPMPAGIPYVSGSATAVIADAGGTIATLTGNSDSSHGYTLTANPSTSVITVTMPSPLPVTNGPLTITLTMKGTIANVSSNKSSNKRTNPPVNNTATLRWQNAGGVARSTTASAAVTVIEPLLSIAKTDNTGGAPAAAGQSVTYTVRTTNSSASNTSTSYNTTITDPLPTGLTPTNYAPATYDSATNTLSWAVGSLAPGASQSYTYVLTMPNPGIAGATYSNTATVTGTSLQSGGRTASDGYPGYQASSTDKVTLAGATVRKSVSPTSAAVGDTVTYTATMTIPANLEHYNLTLLDTLPNGMVFESYGSSSCTNADTSSCSITATGLGTPSPASNGTTALGWYLGDDVAPSNQVRTVTVTYTAHPAKSYANGSPVNGGATLVNSIAAYWNRSQQSTPTTIPSPGSYSNASSSASATVTVLAPVLSISKTVSNSTPAPGQSFTYQVTVSNGTGASVGPAYQVTVTDVIPAGLAAPTSISDGGTYDSGSRTITWTLFTPPNGLTPGQSKTLTYSDTLGPSSALSTGQRLTNTAAISSYYTSANGPGGDPSRYVHAQPTNLTSSATVSPIFPKLAITKTTSTGAPSGTATLGAPFGWKVTISNPSSVTPATATATDVLPVGWTYDAGSTSIALAGGGTSTVDPSVSTSGGQQTLTWTSLGTLAPGTSAVITFTATPTLAALLGQSNPNTNQASVSATDGAGYSSNATGIYGAGPATATAIIPATDLTIQKGLVGYLYQGRPSLYTLTVGNNGPDPAAGATVSDTFPTGITPTATSVDDGAWSCTITGQQLSCTYGGLYPVGHTSTISVEVQVGSSAANPTVNTATVSSTTPDTDPSNNTSSVTDPVYIAKLDLVKTQTSITDVNHNGLVDTGDIINYSMTATNSGNVALTNVSITDPLITNAGGTLSCTPSQPVTLQPTDTVTCTGSYTITQAETDAGSVLNVARSSGVDPTKTTVNSPDGIVITPTDRVSTLSLTKKVTSITDTNGDGHTDTGDIINYSMTTTNTGTTTVTNVSITDPLITNAGGTLSCTPTQPATLLPAASITCTGSYTITQADTDAGSITNVASATGTDPEGSTIPPVNAQVTTPADQDPELSLVKRVTSITDVTSSGDVTADDIINYEIVVTNTGNVTMSDVTITDPLIEEHGGELVCAPVMPSTLAPGAEMVCTASYAVLASDVDEVVNVASASGRDPGGTIITPPDASVTTPTAIHNHLAVVKKVASITDVNHNGITDAGDLIHYRIVATNTGSSTLSSVTISDPMLDAAHDALDCTPGMLSSLSPGEEMVCTATYTVTQADTNARHVDNTATAAATGPNGAAVNAPPSTVTTPTGGPGGLALVKKVTSITDVNHDGITDAGDIINYSMTATNTGPIDLSGVSISDPLITGAGGTLTCTPIAPAKLAPGGTITCTGSYTITAANQAAGTVINVATASGTDPSGKPVASNQASATVVVQTPGSGGNGGNGGKGGSLAFTGAQLASSAAVGVLLLGAGAILVLLTRRRRSA